jgi:Purple acid Phosphatase, N-terminal domain
VGPVISQPVARTGPGRVTITWTTDVPADSQVQYGPTTAYASSTPLDRTLASNHSVTITGLARRSQYFFQVLSRDGVGNLSAATGSFRTK